MLRTGVRRMLDELEGFETALDRHFKDIISRFPNGMPRVQEAVIGEMHCSRCSGSRRMKITLYYPDASEFVRAASRLAGRDIICCSLSCVQCDAQYYVLKYPGPNGPALAVMSNTHGGLSTQHTPEAVAYYLDQAYKAHCVGADSAAVTMFRSALEHLLYEQGYQTGMLGPKIAKLEADIAKGGGPAWARDLDTEFIKVLKDLGNAAIHTNSGDIKKQAHIDSELVSLVQATFFALIQVVYEIPKQKTMHLTALQARVKLMK
jgi:hypothetical protein